jgi:S1-C subfamily serine protease
MAPLARLACLRGEWGPADRRGPRPTPIGCATALLSLGALLWMPAPTAAELALAVDELVLRAKPAVVLVETRVDADITLDCGAGPITVNPSPYRQTGTAWFVDGRGYLITNAHVVDPAHRVLPWVTAHLASRAVDQACVDPALAAVGLQRGQRPDLETRIRRRVERANVVVTRRPQVTVLLSNGATLPVEIVKVSPPLSLYSSGEPTPDSGRDLALLRTKDGVYPALGLSGQLPLIGQPVRILGFPGAVLNHELLNESARLEASVASGIISGFKQDVTGREVIQTDAPAGPGNSGGPAVGPHGVVVGILTFLSLSGADGDFAQRFNFLIPAGDITEFLQGTEVTRPGNSRFNPVWLDGLRDMRHAHFVRARSRFAEANELLPGLVDVKRALARADAEAKHSPPHTLPWVWIAAGVSLTCAGAGGVFWHRPWRGAGHRVQSGKPRPLTRRSGALAENAPA